MDSTNPQLLTLVAEHTRGAMLITDKDRRILWANRGFCELTGYQLSELQGRSPGEFLQGPASDEQTRRAIRAGLESGEGFNGDILNYRRDGSQYWTHLVIDPVHNDRGELTHFVGLQTDITSLRRSYSLNEALLRATNDIVVAVDTKGIITHYNQGAEDLLGYPAQEIIGLATPEVLHDPSELAEWAREINGNNRKIRTSGLGAILSAARSADRAGHGGIERECHLVACDGTRIPVRVRITAVRDTNGIVTGYLGSIRDLRRSADALEARERLEGLAALVPGCLYQYQMFPDGSSCFPYVSINGSEIYEVTPEEVREDASAIISRIHPHDAPRVTASIAESAAKGSVWRDSYRVNLPKRGLRWVHGESIPVPQRDGSVLWNGYFSDITPRKEAELALLHITRMQTLLMDLSRTYISLPVHELEGSIGEALEKMGQFIGADRAYLFIYDDEADSFTNTHEWCKAGITPQKNHLQDVSNATIPDWVEKTRRGEIILIPDVQALPRDCGERKLLEPQDILSLIAIPMMDAEHCIGFVGFDSVRQHRTYSTDEQKLLTVFTQLLINVRKRREVENTLAQAAERAEGSNRAKSAFLANMSHEIRTPMNGVLGMSELLLGTELDNQQQEWLRTIIRSSEHLLTIINDILDFSRIESGKMGIETIRFDLPHLIHESLEPFRSRLVGNEVELLVRIDPELARWQMGDPGRVRQILTNLVGNAVKFTEQGHILVEASEQDGTYQIAVSDTGIGISEERQAALFQPFEQEDSSTARRFGGSGLGLAICRRLAELMGGRIDFTSVPGEGSTFRLSLALQPATDQARSDAPADPLPCENEDKPFAGLRILMAEDNLVNQQVTQLLLGKLGATDIQVASEGAAAVAAVAQSRPDLLLLDVQMPGMDGYETTKIIRSTEAREGLPRLPIIALTANAMKSDRDRCLAVGMDGYISKPLRSKDLRATICSCLSRIPKPPHMTPEAATTPEQHPLINQETLEQVRDLAGPDCESLYREALDEINHQLEGMRSAQSRNDIPALHAAAHALKGAAGALGLDSLTEAARSIEQAAREGQFPGLDPIAAIAAATADAIRQEFPHLDSLDAET